MLYEYLPCVILLIYKAIFLYLQSLENIWFQVAAGRAHTVMVTGKEGVWTVGNNAYGQCGRSIIADEDYGKQTIYNRIRILDQLDIAQVECGQDTR